ncbi:putative enzyme [Candidatus Nitrotoga sp. BS]|uniref:glycosyltransferase family 2 protein n=1 Tax=Candidatus Nitrotoga sp. BS TaxID=2890408 RepID=UPI001EF297CC|nr:glycosyltransferase [Candidatus Nitrotoga sp. BS]CAH1202361.1 putative enzyme [Candidatus Nitrotoga sp. BS]
MIADPLISVCIASYNHEKYLVETIESVLTQSYQNLEVIIVDDASADQSPQILRNYQSNNCDRVRVMCLQKNIGPSGALNLAFEDAKGQFIALLGSDDRMRPNRLKKQLEFMQNHSEIGALFTRVNCIDEDGQLAADAHAGDVFDTPITDIRWQLLHQNILNAPSAMIRRDVINRVGFFSPVLLYVQDYDYWLRVLDDYEIYVLPERLTDYRIHGENLSMQKDGPRFGSYYETVITILRAIERWPLEKLVTFNFPVGSPGCTIEKSNAQIRLASHCLDVDRRYFGKPFICTAKAYVLALAALEIAPKNPMVATLLNDVYAALGDGPRSLGEKSIPLQSWLGIHGQKTKIRGKPKLLQFLDRHLLWRFKKQ